MADTPSNNAAAPTSMSNMLASHGPLLYPSTHKLPALTNTTSLLPDNPESEVPAVQDTPTEDPAETHPTEEDAEQPDGACAKRPGLHIHSGHYLTLLTRRALPREDRLAPRRPAIGAPRMLTIWNILEHF